MVSSTNPAYSLTVRNTASASYSLNAMTVVVVIFLPLVLAYQIWSYYVFRRRVSREQFLPAPRLTAVPAPARSLRRRCRPMRHRAPRHLRWPVTEESDMAESYDVIVIGTGAGGGTLARHLAPSGKKRTCCSNAATRLPRRASNWSTLDVFDDGQYVSPDSWYSVGGQVLLPAAGALLRRRRHQAVRRRALPDARKDFGELRPPRRTRPPGPSATRT